MIEFKLPKDMLCYPINSMQTILFFLRNVFLIRLIDLFEVSLIIIGYIIKFIKIKAQTCNDFETLFTL